MLNYGIRTRGNSSYQTSTKINRRMYKDADKIQRTTDYCRSITQRYIQSDSARGKIESVHISQLKPWIKYEDNDIDDNESSTEFTETLKHIPSPGNNS